MKKTTAKILSVVFIVLGISLFMISMNKSPLAVLHFPSNEFGFTRGVNVEENLLDIPAFAQTRNLSCEAAAIKMLLSFYGQFTEEEEILKLFEKNKNPHLGFRGNVDGPIFGFDDYGAYPNAVMNVLTKLGIPSTAFKNLDENQLKKYIIAGKPAIIWVVVANKNPKKIDTYIDKQKVTLISGEHTVVVKGYKNNKWYINDPWAATGPKGEKIAKELVVTNLDELKWDYFDHMAVVVN